MPYKNKEKEREYQKNHSQFYRDFYRQNPNKRLRDFLEVKQCLKCQIEFKPKNGTQKFCCFKCRLAYNYKINPITNRPKTRDEYKNQDLIKRYKITLIQYNQLLKNQDNKCAICGKEETRKSKYGGICRLHIDHDHKTQKVRGLLCNKCNNMLGFADDDIKIFENAIKYLNQK